MLLVCESRFHVVWLGLELIYITEMAQLLSRLPDCWNYRCATMSLASCW